MFSGLKQVEELSRSKYLSIQTLWIIISGMKLKTKLSLNKHYKFIHFHSYVTDLCFWGSDVSSYRRLILAAVKHELTNGYRPFPSLTLEVSSCCNGGLVPRRVFSPWSVNASSLTHLTEFLSCSPEWKWRKSCIVVSDCEDKRWVSCCKINRLIVLLLPRIKSQVLKLILRLKCWRLRQIGGWLFIVGVWSSRH